MSNFGPYFDSPDRLQDEGNRISITLEKTGNNGSIKWTIPSNINSDAFLPEIYDGILILLDTKPINATPINGTFYESDNTVDSNKHVGDIIDEALVIGAFYNDKKTKELVITDLQDKVNYYVAGYAVDNTRSYHKGVFSYPLPLITTPKTNDTSGYHVVKLGVLPTDDPKLTKTEKFEAYIDDTTYKFDVEPVSTYQDLIDQLNLKFAQLSNAFVGPEPMNTNGYFIDKDLYLWDGHKAVKQECLFNENPNQVANGTFWINNGLQKWDDKWVAQHTYEYSKPLDQISCNDVWFDGKIAYKWDDYNWKKYKTHLGETDPSLCSLPKCGTVWYNKTNFYKFDKQWLKLDVFTSNSNPLNYLNGYYWFNGSKVFQLIEKKWVEVDVAVSATQPNTRTKIWYNTTDNKLYEYTLMWGPINVNIITFTHDVTVPGEWYWYSDVLNKWDEVNEKWVVVKKIITDTTDPNKSKIKTNDFWFNGTLHQWDGSQWDVYPEYLKCDKTPSIDDYWYNGHDYFINNNGWTKLDTVRLTYDFSVITTGQYWYNTKTSTLYMWNGLNWVSLYCSKSSLVPQNGALWYDLNTMYQWNGSWLPINKKAHCELVDGNIKISSGVLGSKSKLHILEVSENVPTLFSRTSPVGRYERIVIGTDHISEVPMYKQLGVGTDGSLDERRDLIHNMLLSLGYPSIQIELDKSQLELCVELALRSFRKLSASAYDRSIFFLDLIPGQQSYLLTDGTVGLNKIVDIQAIYRRNSSFMSSSAGNNIYSQQFLQWLYTPSAKMDLTSYHIISNYIETMNIMFSARIVFRFYEKQRRLDIYQNIGIDERVIVDCTVERTEQDLITDRMASKWIMNWALAEAYQMLANVRGKYSNVPGAGGSVSLNASDMQARADALFELCNQEIFDYTSSEAEMIGLESTIVFG